MKKGQETKAKIKDLVIYHQNQPKKQVRLHSHKEAHLFIPIRGNIKINVEQDKINVSPGKMFFLKGSLNHSFESDENQGERLIILLNSAIKESKILTANNLLKEVFFNILLDHKSSSAIKSVNLIKQIIKEQLEVENFDISQLHSHAKDSRVLDALELMDSYPEVDIATIALKIGSTTKTLNRLFKQELSFGPKQIQTSLRIDRARTLLKSGHLNVTEVAFKVGFNSLSSFIKNYRNITGHLPSDESHH